MIFSTFNDVDIWWWHAYHSSHRPRTVGGMWCEYIRHAYISLNSVCSVSLLLPASKKARAHLRFYPEGMCIYTVLYTVQLYYCTSYYWLLYLRYDSYTRREDRLHPRQQGGRAPRRTPPMTRGMPFDYDTWMENQVERPDWSLLYLCNTARV